jgi:Flp pilus assembly pilin Flp
MVAQFLQDESGQDMAEYALLLTLIGAVALVALVMTGGGVTNILSKISDKLFDQMKYSQPQKQLA